METEDFELNMNFHIVFQWKQEPIYRIKNAKGEELHHFSEIFEVLKMELCGRGLDITKSFFEEITEFFVTSDNRIRMAMKYLDVDGNYLAGAIIPMGYSFNPEKDIRVLGSIYSVIRGDKYPRGGFWKCKGNAIHFRFFPIGKIFNTEGGEHKNDSR